MVPLWTSKDSAGDSILTMQSPGKAKTGEPTSILDLALPIGIKSIFLVETGMTGFMTALNNTTDAKVKLCYGLKLKICRNVADKTAESRDTESNVIIFLKDSHYYSNFIKIWNRANVDHFYYYPRLDSNVLKEFWHPDGLMLAFPFYSSFLAKNFLTLSECIVDFEFTKPIFFVEDSGLPFDHLIRNRVTEFTKNNNLRMVASRSIYYHKYSDFKNYQIMRCITNKSSLDRPELEHFSSDRFCFEDYLNSMRYEYKG